ncbi:MAG: hypothetical protein EKK48_19090 [Candidatus Melainabacteria bacterium]|nr:MAG: hypothetical protein EKK48_19090 [Candidatus Melainabacteria bacterium]
MTKENVTTGATAAENVGLQQLVVQLNVLRRLGCAVVDNRGHRINGVVLNGADRVSLVQSIASQTGMVIIEESALVFSTTFRGSPRLNPVKTAFENAIRVSRRLQTPVLLYIQNFEEIGSRTATGLSESDYYELGNKMLDELRKLDCNDENKVFVVVSSAVEVDMPFTVAGRLPRLEAFCADY